MEKRTLGGFSLGTGEQGVLLLHGWGGVSSDMADIATAVAGAGYRAVALDLPGHGSDRGSRTDLFRMAAAIDAVSAMHGMPSAVVAHSFGAAATFAAFPHGGPGRVVLLAPAMTSARHIDRFGEYIGLHERAREAFTERLGRFAGPHVLAILNGEGDIPGAEFLLLHDPEDPRTDFVDSKIFAERRPAARLEAIGQVGHHRILLDEMTIAKLIEFVGGADLPIPIDR